MKSLFVAIGLLSTLFCGVGKADFMLNVSSSNSNVFEAGSGIRSVSVDITGAGSGHSTQFLTAVFNVSSAVFTSPTPGTFNTIGQIAYGNTSPQTGSSSFTTYNNGSSSILSIDFLNETNAITNGQLASFAIDTTGLTPGIYDINIGYLAAGPGNVSSVGGGFTITTPSAVPEPSSMALLGLVAAGGAAFRRFRKKAPKAKELEAV